MKTCSLIAALAAASGLAVAASAALAQSPPPPATEVAADRLVLTLIPAKGGAKLKVSSPAFKDGGDIPFENTQYKGNVFPGLAWSKGPKGAQTYAVIMQDTDGQRNGEAILHWTMYDIPAGVTSLAAAMTDPPAGAVYGPNIVGPHHAYMGPRTPPGPKHRYHLQVFALDTPISVNPDLKLDGLKAAMTGHVLASGQVVGLGQADPDAPKPAPRPVG
jgi:para-nitrobenzyl esterase